MTPGIAPDGGRLCVDCATIPGNYRCAQCDGEERLNDHLLGVEAGIEPGAEHRIELVTVAGLQQLRNSRASSPTRWIGSTSQARNMNLMQWGVRLTNSFDG
jgi:hypothetical protein